MILSRKIIIFFLGVGIITSFFWYLNFHLIDDVYAVLSTEDRENLASVDKILNTSDLEQKSYTVSSTTPQFVVLSFDGSKSLQMLDATRDFVKKMNSEGKPLHFTYFVNAAYFLTEKEGYFYQAPREVPGFSNIGFADSDYDIGLRVQGFNQALREGNEIGSHSVGHFNGDKWTEDEWSKEFEFFNGILFSRSFGVFPYLPQKLSLKPENLFGFRAPDLAVNDNLFKALKRFNFEYDGSGINTDNSWPKKDDNGIWHIPMGIVKIGPNLKPTLAMDYSIWQVESGGRELAKAGTPLWDNYLKEVESAYMDYFNKNYNDGRAPVSIGGHFSLWNDGVYFEAMKKFAENVCGLPNVRCVTYKELVDYLNKFGVPQMFSR